MTPTQTYDPISFGRALTIGQPVIVAWGYGSGFRAMGCGTVEKLNRRTVRVTLTEPVASPFSDDPAQSWRVGHIITVVRPDDVTNKLLHPNNTVHPAP